MMRGPQNSPTGKFPPSMESASSEAIDVAPLSSVPQYILPFPHPRPHSIRTEVHTNDQEVQKKVTGISEEVQATLPTPSLREWSADLRAMCSRKQAHLVS